MPLAPVYSERFLRHSAGASGIYTVPAGKRVIVQSVSAVTDPAASGLKAWQLDVGVFATAAFSFPVNVGGHTEELRVVVYAGEAIKLWTYGSSISATVCGYLFDDPTRALADDVDELQDGPGAPFWADWPPEELDSWPTR